MKEPKIGDIVITEGYSSDYDGRKLRITEIITTQIGTKFCRFKPLDDGYHKPNDNFMIFRIVKIFRTPISSTEKQKIINLIKSI